MSFSIVISGKELRESKDVEQLLKDKLKEHQDNLVQHDGTLNAKAIFEAVCDMSDSQKKEKEVMNG